MENYVDTPATLKKGKEIWEWTVPCCPFCGKKHTHGGGSIEDDPLAHAVGRVAHCMTGDGGNYMLVLAPESP